MKTRMPLLKASALLASALLLTNTASAASKTWAVSGGDTNWSNLDNWSPTGVPVAGDDVIFFNAVSNTVPTTNNVVDPGFSAQIRSLFYGHTNCNQGTLITAPSLTVSGTGSTPNPLFVGTGDNGPNNNTNLTIISGTALNITNTSSAIMVRQAGSGGGTHRAILNMSGLDTFTARVLSFLTGYEDDGLLTDRRPVGTVFFARTNIVTCTASGMGFQIGHVVQQAGGASTNRLGQVNFLNANAIRIGGAKTANSALNFNSGLSNPSVTFRNAAGTGRMTTFYVADNATSGSSGNCTAFVDFTGGTVDALVDTIYVGRGQSANTAYYAGGNGTLTFSAGTIDVNTLELGYQVAAGSSAGRGIFNVNGTGLLSVNKDIRLARNLGPGSGSLVTNSIGNLNINAGTVRVYGNVADGGGTSILTVTNNGTLDLKPAGDSVAGNIGARVLNIGAGVITNYATLSVSNLNVLSPGSEFTIYPGQTLGVIGTGLAGTMTVNTNLTLSNASLALDLGTPGVNSDQVTVLGSLKLDGVNSVRINPLSGFGPGSYPIATYGTGLTGDVTNNLVVGGGMEDSRYSLYFDTETVPATIMLNVSGGPAANLTWSGDGVGNVWNLHQTFNWNDGGGANNARFYNLDAVTFDDTGSANPAVNLVGTLVPSSVTVFGTQSYTFGGSGKISGPGGLTYISTGTLTLLATNDYSGTTIISSGTVQVGNGTTADGGIGTGQIDNNGALIFNSASFQSVPGIITGTGAITKRGPGVTQLSGISYFSAPVTNEAGTLLIGNGDALGDTFYGTTINDGASLDLGGSGIGSEPVYVSGTGVGGAGAIVNSGVTAGSLNNLTLLGPTTFGGSALWVIGAGASAMGLQANSNKITKIGPNTVEYSGGDEFAIADPGLGDLEIQSGTFMFYGYVGLGDPSKTITVRSNATLQLDCTGDSLTVKALVLDGGATLRSTLPNRLMPQYSTVPGPISLGGAVTFNVVATDAVNLLGEVSGTGPLIKGNPGLLTFAASNSFTGDLSIQSGTVALTGDGSITRAANIILAGTTLDVSGRSDLSLTLASGQTLKGNGTIIGTLVSPSDTTVLPGASVGTINVSGDATLRGNTVMEMSKVAAAYTSDLLAVTGTLDLGGNLTVTYSGDALQAGDTFTLFTAGFFANAFTSVSLPEITGVVWTNMTAIDGTVRVLSAPVPAQPTVTGGTQLPGGTFQLDFSGPVGYSYSVRASEDLTLSVGSWQVIGTGTFGSGPANFVDANAPDHPQRFYLISIP